MNDLKRSFSIDAVVESDLAIKIQSTMMKKDKDDIVPFDIVGCMLTNIEKRCDGKFPCSISLYDIKESEDEFGSKYETNYEKIVNQIKKASTTQLPALASVVMKEGYEKGVFLEGFGEQISKKIESECLKRVEEKEVVEDVSLTCGGCGARYVKKANYIHSTCGLNGCKGRLHKLS